MGNQNLGLILESAGSKAASDLGVALFALTSSLSRIVVGTLSDRYSQRFTRFDWLIVIVGCGILSQLSLSSMALGGIMLGVLLSGLSFGAFFAVIVPTVNEMYGRAHFGVIMGSQLASQCPATLLISLGLLPGVYWSHRAEQGEGKCFGAACFRLSFLLLAFLQGFCLIAACLLRHRNRSSMPLERLRSPRARPIS